MKKLTANRNFTIIEWTSLPQEFKDETADWPGFSNDCYLLIGHELDELTQREMDEWHADINASGEELDYEDFLDLVGLRLVDYIIKNYVIEDIRSDLLLKICW